MLPACAPLQGGKSHAGLAGPREDHRLWAGPPNELGPGAPEPDWEPHVHGARVAQGKGESDGEMFEFVLTKQDSTYAQ